MDDFSRYYPYKDQEFKEALQQLVSTPYYEQLATKLFPEILPEELKDKILGLDDVDQFQAYVMYRVCCHIIQNSISEFTYSGFEHIRDSHCLFISNHRDITVDAVLTEYILISNHLKASHVVVGSNLYDVSLMPLLARLNKMSAIERGGSPKKFYNSLMSISNYLRHQVVERGERAWIAQRNGRTKDGIDRTDPALLKMIAASGNRHDTAQSLGEMNIIPISISYEWEPCGLQKAREVCLWRQGPYTKSLNEDRQSILSGILDFKGRVHLTFCEPLRSHELQAAGNDFNAIAQLIDRRIRQEYRLWPNNYIAHELITGTSHAQHYSAQEKEAFKQYLDDACRRHHFEGFSDTLLQIYGAAIP